ncbi:C40 family peptidase [Streptomyces genisteinicus]|uniref:C40 family peptidase n=1 Tax=Streptomyces genisteinicus TaxID=2768068 RepID=A0A7H0HWA9_9ACTN|nr:C40 family peptidase [Streptomyces genisteinicus]QNP64825.1 C40 family peptidase [Streptomyces genisteinicus]
MAAHRKPHRSPHRKPQQRPLAGPAARTAAALALAGAAATASSGLAHAEPRLTPAQIKAQVDDLYQQAEAATEKYNGAKERTDTAREALDALRDRAARSTEQLGASRDALGAFATAQYRSDGIDPGLRLALTSDPDTYLERASLAERVGDRQARAVADVRRHLTGIAGLRAEAGKRFAELDEHRRELSRHKGTVQNRLAAAERLLARLTAEQRSAYERGTAEPARADRSDRDRAPAAAPGSRAAQAIAYAYGALGKPYVWGATGPGAYDCSGLTQAAWKAAGVSLPRTTYTQIDAGRRVARSQLAPGDLVFFYSGVSHVGLYIGDGRMIHAPRPGAPVRIAPIDEMPFAGATRVG